MPHRLTPLAAALLLSMLAPVSSSALAAPAVAHWTLTELGTLGGTVSIGQAINNAGQVTGSAFTTGNAAYHAFLYSNGGMTDLGTLGGTSSFGEAINNAGQVTGSAYTTGNAALKAFLYSNGGMTDLGTLGGSSSNGNGINDAGQVAGYSSTTGNVAEHAFLYSNGGMTDLGTLGGSSSSGGAINHFGQVTGGAYTSGGAVHAFLYRNGAMTDLGTLGGSYSTGSAINHFGQVTGSASIANGADHAFLYNNGGMTDLGTLGGSSSNGQAINNAGQVTGYATTAGGAEHAFLFSNGQMHDVNSFNGVAGMGWTLRNAAGINDVGQIVGSGFVPAGTRAYVLTLNTTVWGGAPNASWDDAANWSYGIGPNKNTHVYIEPVGSRTVLGPTGAVDLKRLTIGGNPADGSAIATLKLNGGQINLLSDTNVSLALTAGLELTANGVLTGQGTIRNGNVNGFNFSSYGRIVADDVSLKRMDVSNHGTIEGDGRLAASLIYNDGGHIRIAHAGDRLKLDAEVINYVGAIDVIRGEVEITGELKNESQVNLRDGILRTDTFKNFGRFEISSGASDVFGSVSNEDIGRIIVSGQGQVTFWNTVESYGELRVSNGAVATFFGDFYARTNKLTGTGSKYYEAGYFIGNSPGVASDEGNVAFGSEAFVEVEIGGLAAGNGDGFHDKLIVLGDLGLDGTLKLVSWKGFTGQAGESFDLFDWGTLSGTFDNIDSSGLLLAAGATLDTRRLYIDGTISVTAVPEPETWAMLLVGLGLVGWTVRRRRNA